ncbi:TRAP transporter large permease [Halalkalibacter okhensis]|uniref:TRAP transporter large permease n=1 Tax=Halalkalibacter okhensis TaxID=333138 RepID=UPI00068EDAB4|nr:TRAP transporter large permease [Halalkalibacter okhensis]
MEILIASLVVILLMFLGMAVSFSFLTGSLLYILITGTSMRTIVTTAFFSLESFTLLAIPLFMIAGRLMEVSGIAERLIEFSRALLRKVKGGMGAIIPVSSMMFGALSGSGTATVAALSSILIPRMEKLGWDKRYSAALLGASGPLGYMIPPNMNAILFGVVANTSIAALFLATVVPGILWALLYILINRIIYPKWYREPESNSSPAGVEETAATTSAVQRSYFTDVFTTFKMAIPAFIMPLIIFGGIYGGAFTPTEAGAVACIYALIAGAFIFKTITIKNGLDAFTDTGKSVGSILIILPMVMIFTRLLVLNNVPHMIAEGMQNISTNPNVLLFLIVLILFFAGFFLSTGVLIFVFTPLLMPTANAIGLDPIQLGTILFVAIGVGTLTPPLAMNLFVVSRTSGVPMQDLMKPLLPFLFFGAIPILFLVTYVPEISLWLPRLIMG